MTPFLTRGVTKIYRRIVNEIIIEWPLLIEKWRFVLFGLLWQYVHGVAARVAHYLHHPGPLLHDVGFYLLPATIPQYQCFLNLFLNWLVEYRNWGLRRLGSVRRVFAMLVIAQSLRVISFLVTQLPGPNYHCREGSPTATLPPPKHITDVLLLNFPYGVIYGCGDLIFSSHMTFAITFVHTYARYGTNRWIKRAAWLLVIVQSFLIVASRKHYTVDVVIAWYVVILMFNYVGRKFYDPEVMDRTPSREQVLPALSKKDNRRSKEELQKLVTNGHATEHWDIGRLRNGKTTDDGNPTLEVIVNGNF